MCAGRFPNTRRSSDEDSSEHIRSILAGLFETRFQAYGPERNINTMVGGERSEITSRVTIVGAYPPALYCRRSLSDFGVRIELSTVVWKDRQSSRYPLSCALSLPVSPSLLLLSWSPLSPSPSFSWFSHRFCRFLAPCEWQWGLGIRPHSKYGFHVSLSLRSCLVRRYLQERRNLSCWTVGARHDFWMDMSVRWGKTDIVTCYVAHTPQNVLRHQSLHLEKSCLVPL